MKYWRGSYVIVFPRGRWKFHTCVVCGRGLKFSTTSSESGVGSECARKEADRIEKAKTEALEADRRRYDTEVRQLGFTIED